MVEGTWSGRKGATGRRSRPWAACPCPGTHTARRCGEFESPSALNRSCPRSRCRRVQAMGDVGRCDGRMGLLRGRAVPQLANDHHAFHEDAKPGNLSPQFRPGDTGRRPVITRRPDALPQWLTVLGGRGCNRAYIRRVVRPRCSRSSKNRPLLSPASAPAPPAIATRVPSAGPCPRRTDDQRT